MDIKVAAVQMDSVLYARDVNLERAQRHIEHAANQNADLIVLPELFTTGLCYDTALSGHAEPIRGNTTAWLQAQSRATGAYIGGSIIEKCGQSCFNTFVLAGPQGELHFYRKRFLPFFENLIFGRGTRTGIFHTPLGRIGVLICWDMIHDRLIRRMQSRVDLLLVSAAWPDLASGNIALPGFQDWISRQPFHRPLTLAKRLKVPVVSVNATGLFKTPIPIFSLHYQSEYAGCSSIVQENGEIQRLEREDQVLLGQVQMPTLAASWTDAA